jgi:8-hydroxy-5-deazaflavin:NADPH oxidoreductase
MKITVIGRGKVGGGLARRWRDAGHDVTELGRDGGDASDADVVLVAVPGGEIAEALGKVTGLDGKVAIDATNFFGDRDDGHESRAHEIKSIVGGPVAKAFNTNFAAIYDRIDDQEEAPGNLYAGDDDAREVTERLSRDAGFDPVYAGGLENAHLLETHLALESAISRAGLGPFFYRIEAPGPRG